MYHCWTPERLEKKAVEILSKYKGGDLLLKPQAMDVDDFAEFYCKTTIDFAYLSQDGLTLGLTCFHEGKIIVWDETRTIPNPMDVEKGYIFVDKDVLEYDVEGRVRFTVIHECSHYMLHPRFYYKKPGVEMPRIECSVYHVDNWDKIAPMTDEEVREWQANRLGAALIMPAKTTRMLMAQNLNIGVDELTPVYLSDCFIEDMAGAFVVSKTAMRNRLRDLDLLLQ